jgi:hypothetical protein
MARYFGIGPDKSRIAYNLERCEEVVLIDAYLKVRDRLQPTEPLRNEFEYYFFQKGQGIAADTIDGLNAYLRRAGQPILEFRETTVFDYGRNADRVWKAQERAKIKDELESTTVEARERVVAFAQIEMQGLPLPHRTWEEYREDQERLDEETRLAREAVDREALRRRLASPTSKPAMAKPALPPETAAKLLAATDDEELRGEIIGRIGAADLLTVIGTVTDAGIKNKLIRRMLNGG